ncbi:Mak16 protein [Atractiella rhizophila]|nr:Mak16 protein [Atractiella rhizophila]
MQSDDVIWSIINNQFCSYKIKTPTQNFCRNEYNVSGLCNRMSCPLANARYATVREIEGTVYLFVKTAERSHSPKHMWEKVTLSRDYGKALAQIDEELLYWPEFLKHKCKQRLTKITQYLIRIQKSFKKDSPLLVGIKPKLERRERAREAKALNAAQIERNLEKELLSRLRNRAYGEMPLNVNEDVWKRVLDRERRVEDRKLRKERGEDVEAEEDLDLQMESDDSAEMEELDEREFVSDLEEEEEDLEEWLREQDLTEYSNDEEGSDEEDVELSHGDSPEPEPTKGKRKREAKAASHDKRNKKRPKRVEIEYEKEMETAPRAKELAF